MAITFVGDVFLPAPVHVVRPFDGELVLNLESPITTTQRGVSGKINLKSEQDHLAATFGTSILAVNLANNHVMDYGAEGLADTRAALEAAGIPYFGAGTWSERCGNPLLVNHNGVLVALAGYACPSTGANMVTENAPGVAPLDVERIAEDLRRARGAGATYVVVSLHWGAEEAPLPRPDDVSLARALAGMGVDLVIGHHAHRVQPFEAIDGTQVFYGLGNCIMPDLDVPSNYDPSGTPTQRFRKRQHAWNRRSLAITVEPDSGRIDMDGRWFDGRRLTRVSPRFARRRLQANDGTYARRFRAAFVAGKLQARLWSYVRDPKWPTLARVRSLMRMFRPREYK